MAELFASLAPTPLAERLRPKALGDILGQDHLLGPEGPIGRMLADLIVEATTVPPEAPKELNKQ